jgi:hypothetical protein
MAKKNGKKRKGAAVSQPQNPGHILAFLREALPRLDMKPYALAVAAGIRPGNVYAKLKGSPSALTLERFLAVVGAVVEIQGERLELYIEDGKVRAVFQ